NYSAFGIVSITFLTPANCEPIELPAIHYEGNGFGRFTKCNRQRPGGERIERTGMPCALGIEQPFHHADRVRGGHADRLVEHDPAMYVVLVAFFLLRPCRAFTWTGVSNQRLFQIVVVHSLSLSSCRSRFTSGDRNSLSMRSASAKRSSIRKR